jgi:hypothetical protein
MSLVHRCASGTHEFCQGRAGVQRLTSPLVQVRRSKDEYCRCEPRREAYPVEQVLKERGACVTNREEGVGREKA